MIEKKTDFLGNLFSGVGPAAYGGAETPETPEKRSFATFGPKFGGYPFAPPPYGYPYGFPFAGPKFAAPGFLSAAEQSPEQSRRKRSPVDDITQDSTADVTKPDVNAGNPPAPPPPYPGLSSIPEENEEIVANVQLQKLVYNPAAVDSAVPKEFMPFAFAPFAPTVDPAFFMSKKTTFLDALFKSLAAQATSTTPAPVTDAAMEFTTPTPKPTIVPPGFWAPSLIPSPTDYPAKVSVFLQKLFESIQNKTAAAAAAAAATAETITDDDDDVTFDQFVGSNKVVRSVDDVDAIAAAKDTISESILTELSSLKNEIVATVTDLITYQKAYAANVPAKSLKPKPEGFPTFWPKPVFDVTLPFQQRIDVLGSIFDTLIDLQRNITTAVQEAAKAKAAEATTPEPQPEQFDSGAFGNPAFGASSPRINLTVLEDINSKLAELQAASTKKPYTGFVPTYGAIPFWAAFAAKDASAGKYDAKRQIPDEEYDYSQVFEHQNDRHDDRHDNYKRAVKMQMHQGYQSLPAGSIESIQAGGGSVPGHQGGGIKLLVSVISLLFLLL